MWEAISSILNSSNGALVIIVLLICVLIAFVLVKSGKLTVNTEVVKIGTREIERRIIQEQMKYVWKHLQEVEANIPKCEGYDEQLGQRIILTVYKEYCDWIAFNHINKGEGYIELRQESVVSIVNALTKDPKYKTEEFKNMFREDTKKTLCALVDIREVYMK